MASLPSIFSTVPGPSLRPYAHSPLALDTYPENQFLYGHLEVLKRSTPDQLMHSCSLPRALHSLQTMASSPSIFSIVGPSLRPYAHSPLALDTYPANQFLYGHLEVLKRFEPDQLMQKGWVDGMQVRC